MIIQKPSYSVLILGIALSLSTNSVSAALLQRDMSITIDSGPLASNALAATFGYDNETLSGSGPEMLSLSFFSFTFQGNPFAATDDSFATVDFLDGNLLGLSYSHDDGLGSAFSFVPGFFDVSEASFTYQIPAGSGAGGITFSPARPAVPIPTTLVLFIIGCLGLMARMHRPVLRGSR